MLGRNDEEMDGARRELGGERHERDWAARFSKLPLVLRG